MTRIKFSCIKVLLAYVRVRPFDATAAAAEDWRVTPYGVLWVVKDVFVGVTAPRFPFPRLVTLGRSENGETVTSERVGDWPPVMEHRGQWLCVTCVILDAAALA